MQLCLVLRLADLMNENKEELATIESLDSGAVYTLALKTHIGMSIETLRYFAGWCDKIEVCSSDVYLFLFNPDFYVTFCKHNFGNVCMCVYELHDCLVVSVLVCLPVGLEM